MLHQEGTSYCYLHRVPCICTKYRMFPLVRRTLRRATHQKIPNQEALHCLSFLLNDGLRAATNCSTTTVTLLCLQHTRQYPVCPSSSTFHTPSLSYVTCYPYQKVVDNLYARYAQLQMQNHCLSGNQLLFANHIPFCPFLTCVDFFGKKEKAGTVPSPRLCALTLQMQTSIICSGF